MLLPKGIEKHRNLSTSFTRFDQLLQELSENRFSGFLKLNSWEYEGVLVLDTGRMIEAYSNEKNINLTGVPAILDILAKSLKSEGSIEVHELLSEVAIGLCYALQAKPDSDDIDLSNYSLEQAFDLLEKKSITGFVDIQFSGKKGFGTVYYLEGTPVESVFMSNSGKVVCGEQVFSSFLEIGSAYQPQVLLNGVKTPKPIVEDEVFIIPWQHQKYIQCWLEFLQYFSKIMIDQLKRNKLYSQIREICTEVSDHYPFLHPESGGVQLTKDKFLVSRILSKQSFLQGMSLVLHKAFQQVPARRLRKLDFKKNVTDLCIIAKKNDISPTQLNPQKLVTQIFRGLV